MSNEDQYDDNRPRFWRAIDALQKEDIIAKEKIRVLEDAFNRHLDYHDGISKSLEDIRSKLETNGGILIEMKKDMFIEKNRVDSIKSLPKSLLTYLGIGATVILGWSQVFKWITHSFDVKIK